MIPYLNMQARVELGSIFFTQVVAFTIDEDIKRLGNSATIVLPRNIKKLKGKPVRSYINAGDKVTISAGYNGSIAVEFTGFIRSIGSETPMVIECDDEYYPLKQNNHVKHYADVKLKQLLQDIIKGYTIDCPDMSLGKFTINNASSYRVLEQLQKDYGLYSRIIGNTIVVGFAWDWNFDKTKNHKYHFQKNVKESNLKWKSATDFKTRVEVKLDKVKGQQQQIVKYGSNETEASVLTVKMNGITAAEAKKIAEAIYTRNSYDGFAGSFMGFGFPRSHAGDSAFLQDGYQPEKDGSYLIEKVVIGFNETQGYYRNNFISYKI